MNTFFFYITTFFLLCTYATILKHPKELCSNPEFFIKEARKVERSIGEDYVVFYHGETLATFVYQNLLKSFQSVPLESNWLPLRFPKQDLNDINQVTLLDYLSKHPNENDHSSGFRELALSVSLNLYSLDSTKYESAWSFACRHALSDWHISLGAGGQTNHLWLAYFQKHFFKSKKQSQLFIQQLNVLFYMIQIKRKLQSQIREINLQKSLLKYFPTTADKIKESQWQSILSAENEYKGLKRFYTEGVILQLILPKSFAKRSAYFSHEFGYLKSFDSKSKYYHSDEKRFYMHDLDLEKEFLFDYKRLKHSDIAPETQLRLAMGRAFRNYPSPVSIKPLTPLFIDKDDENLFYSMIKEITSTAALEPESWWHKLLSK